MQDTQSIRNLNAIVDDMFLVFENVLDMFRKWDESCHLSFIREVMKLQKLEVQLYSLGYTEEFVTIVVKIVHNNVFTTDLSLSDAGSYIPIM